MVGEASAASATFGLGFAVNWAAGLGALGKVG